MDNETSDHKGDILICDLCHIGTDIINNMCDVNTDALSHWNKSLEKVIYSCRRRRGGNYWRLSSGNVATYPPFLCL